MEKLTANKADAVKYYNAASEDTKEVLRKLFGEEAFAFDFRSIKTYADACHHLGMSEHLITGAPMAIWRHWAWPARHTSS